MNSISIRILGFALHGRAPVKSKRMCFAAYYISRNAPALAIMNRQLAKLLSGNEVRGKVAIAAMQEAVNFTRSLSRHGLEKFLEHHFIPIQRRFNPHDLSTDLLRVQGPFFSGKKADLFHRKRRWRGMACSVLCGRSSLI